ncbi:MAG: hypothetical protein JWM27_83 [Gemmatimonadetes bacterium]|nr:hypothetical protein [Gemmatimonadota bacterium]
MGEAEFWTLTPRIVYALLARRRDREEGERRHREWCAGTIAAIVANQWRDKGDSPAGPEDFFPLLVEGGKTAPAQQSEAHMLAVAEALNTAFGGLDLRGPMDGGSGGDGGVRAPSPELPP